MPVTVAPSLIAAAHAVVATTGAGTWLLWGGLAAFFTALYIGVYVWMRRPKFGEGSPRHPPTAPGHQDPTIPQGRSAGEGPTSQETEPPDAGGGLDRT